MGDPCIRQQVERREHEILSPNASFADCSKGREIPEEQCDIRTIFQRDRDRILHAKSFRRLKGKTQVFLDPEGDHYRTRLTHTLEVAQNARTIARALMLNEDLVEAIAYGHDLGHTPFGHAGERALNSVCPTGFEHNKQSLRVVKYLEKHGEGLNLSYEVCDGIVNHRSSCKPTTLEGKIVRLSDKIAYVNHDIDDAIRGGIIHGHDIPKEITDVIGDTLTKRINTMIHGVVTYSAGKNEIVMNPEIEAAMLNLRKFLFENVYTNPAAKAQEVQAERLVSYLYEYYVDHIDALPEEFIDMIEKKGEAKELVVCDYIAGMTDRFAVAKLKELFIPSQWEVM
ncbi:MAG: deoxyguanosinetriphosphate triphosphohydrolase [Lachnospiraceae bacterium]|nr:deoxyguanosinetriphosphate triphosphohydrolase [Lachnospiraceae bacterium]